MYGKVKDLLPNAPDDITDEMRLELHRHYAPTYIFYKKHSTYVDCYCTHCMSRYQIRYDAEIYTPIDERAHQLAYGICHDYYCDCPHCGAPAQAKAEGIGRQKLTTWNYVTRWIVSENKNTVWAMCGVLESGYGWNQMSLDDMELNYGGSKWSLRYVVEFGRGKKPRMIEPSYGGENLTEKIYEPYIITGGFYNFRETFETFEPDKMVLVKSWLKHILPQKLMPWEDDKKRYKGWGCIKYLGFAINHPAMDTIVKLGGNNVADDIMHNVSYKQVLNIDGKTFPEIFKVEPNTAAQLRRITADGELTLELLKIRYKLQCIYRKPCLDDAVKVYEENPRNYTEIVLPVLRATKQTVTRYYNYIEKQRLDEHDCPNVVQTEYRDYINQCKELGYSLTDEAVSRPTNLCTAHARTTSALHAIYEEKAQQKATEERMAHYKRYMDNCEMYEYEADGWKIVVPTCSQDIVDEGKNMEHCVGGYAKRHMDGKLTILFLRRTCDLKKCAYTIEMHGKKMQQIQGYKNQTPLTPDADAFMKKWLEWVALPESKKHPKPKKKQVKKTA